MGRIKRLCGALIVSLIIVLASFGIVWLFETGRGFFLIGLLIGMIISDIWKLMK